MIEMWWREAEKHKVLPLDDRFAPRFAENAARFQGARNRFVFHAGMGHVPTDVAPDVRSRSYSIEADVEIGDDGAEGVLIAHGDATSGYSLYVKDGHLVHDLNIGGGHEIVTSDRKVPTGAHRLGVRVERLVRETAPAKGARTGVSAYTLLIDGEPAGSLQTQLGFHTLISWSGLDIGRDRSSPVSHYAAPFEFTGGCCGSRSPCMTTRSSTGRWRRPGADGESEAKQPERKESVDCFVASLLAMTESGALREPKPGLFDLVVRCGKIDQRQGNRDGFLLKVLERHLQLLARLQRGQHVRRDRG